jgi:hypothetical protein
MRSQPPPMNAARISTILFFLRFEKKALVLPLMPSPHLKMFPFVFHSHHQFLEARLPADVGSEGS